MDNANPRMVDVSVFFAVLPVCPRFHSENVYKHRWQSEMRPTVPEKKNELVHGSFVFHLVTFSIRTLSFRYNKNVETMASEHWLDFYLIQSLFDLSELSSVREFTSLHTCIRIVAWINLAMGV